MRFAGRDGPFGLGPAIGRRQAVWGAKDAEHAGRGCGKPLEGAAFVFAGPDRLEACQDAVAGREGWAAGGLGVHEHERWRAFAVPGEGAADGITVGVRAGDLDHRRVRQVAGPGEALVAGGCGLAFMGEAFEDAFQRDLMFGAKLEGTGDVTFADTAAGIVNEAANILA